jgi:hypothetical protein
MPNAQAAQGRALQLIKIKLAKTEKEQYNTIKQKQGSS